MKSRMLSGALLLLTLATQAQQYAVTLFEECNFFGRKVVLTAGTYTVDQMRIGNDRLSALQIPDGMKVTIYENDRFQGRSRTYTSDQSCLEPEWRNMASSVVVENTAILPGYSLNDYVTFYNDCSYRGYTKSLRPGSYTGAQLGDLKYNISSMSISGNLQVKAYLNSESLSGYSVILNSDQYCMQSNVNDKIGSLVIESRQGNNGNNGGWGNNGGNGNNGGWGNNNNGYGQGYVTFYQECNFNGNALRLMPGTYSGDRLGLFKYSISSIEIPQGYRVKVYTGSEYNSGMSYTLTSNESCLNGNMRNRIGSVVIEQTGYGNNGGNGGNNGNNGNGNYVILYEDENYRGRSAYLLPGTYNTMQQAGFTDKSLSSITVPAGWRVVIYENPNLSGKSYTITSSRSGFAFTSWNDKASSIVVYRN